MPTPDGMETRTIRLPEDTWRRLRNAAILNRRTITAQLQVIVEEWLEREGIQHEA